MTRKRNSGSFVGIVWALALAALGGLAGCGGTSASPGDPVADGQRLPPSDAGPRPSETGLQDMGWQGDAQAPAPDPLSVRIIHPRRAAMLSSPSVTVRGKVDGDVSYLASLEVNGEPVTPTFSGEFTHTMTSKWGMNVIVVDAVDKAGRKNHVSQAYLNAPSYVPIMPGKPDAMKVKGGVVGRLYQQAIDDGDRSNVNDLASIVARAIEEGVDFDALIPDTFVEGQKGVGPSWAPTKIKYAVKKNGVFEVEALEIVSVQSRPGGVRIRARIPSLRLPARAGAGVYTVRYIGATVVAQDLELDAVVDIAKQSGSPLAVDVASVSVNYGKLTLEFGGGMFPRLKQVASTMINKTTDVFKKQIRKPIQNQIRDLVRDPIQGFVSGFQLNPAATIALPAGIGGQTLDLRSGLDTVTFDSNGGTLRLDTTIRSTTRAIDDPKRGTIASQAAYEPPAAGTRSFEVGLSYDVMNQAFGAAWYGGVLKRDVSELVAGGLASESLPFDITSVKVTIDGQLPPVIQPPAAGEGDFAVALGDVGLTVEIDIPAGSGASGGTLVVKGFVSAVVGGTSSVTADARLVVALANELSLFEIEVTEMTFQGGAAPKLGEVSLTIRALVTELMPSVVPPIIALAIPPIDLSGVGDGLGVPVDKVLRLRDATVEHKSYTAVLTGELQ